MSIDATTVKHIAKLARIRLEAEEVEEFTAELSGIMDWIETLNEVDDDDGEAVASVIEHPLPMRVDVVSDGKKQDDVLKNAPRSEYGCFVVPKVIDQG